MLHSLLNLLLASWTQLVNWLGSTTLGVLIGPIVAGGVFLWLCLRSGPLAASSHIKKALISAGPALCLWSILYGAAVVVTVYDDHMALRRRAQGAKQSADDRVTAEVKALLERIALAERQNARDPDSIYQFGRVVAKLTGATIDLANGTIYYQTLVTYGQFNTKQLAEYRDLSIRCSGFRGGPPPGSRVAEFRLFLSDGACEIVSPRR